MEEEYAEITDFMAAEYDLAIDDFIDIMEEFQRDDVLNPADHNDNMIAFHPLPLMLNNDQLIVYNKWRATQLKTAFGNKILVFGNRTFLRRSHHPMQTGNVVCSWNCCHENCRGRVVSIRTVVESLDDMNIKQLRAHSDQCSLNLFPVEVEQAKGYIFTRCLDDNKSYQEAYDELTTMLILYDESIIDALALPLSNFRRTVAERKRKLFPPLPAPNVHQDIIVPDIFTKTFSDQPFLLWNHRYVYNGEPSRIMIFGTPAYVANLLTKGRVYVDGTFSFVTTPFKQLFTFQAFVHGDSAMIPFMYVFMSHKTKTAYVKVFEWLKAFAALNNIALAWQYITCDFESGLLPAIKQCLQMNGLLVDIIGCYFHYCQALYKKINESGLSNQYRNDAALQTFIRSLMTLPFIPLRSVVDFYFTIFRPVLNPNSQVKLNKFIVYFEKTWLGPDAKFAPNLWNVYDVKDNHTTNNHLESWHYQIKKKCLRKYKKLWCVIEVLKYEQEVSEVKRRVLSLGHAVNEPVSKLRRAKYVAINNCKRLLEAGQLEPQDYFRSIYHNLWNNNN
jgi:hypothetical protein